MKDVEVEDAEQKSESGHRHSPYIECEKCKEEEDVVNAANYTVPPSTAIPKDGAENAYQTASRIVRESGLNLVGRKRQSLEDAIENAIVGARESERTRCAWIADSFYNYQHDHGVDYGNGPGDRSWLFMDVDIAAAIRGRGVTTQPENDRQTTTQESHGQASFSNSEFSSVVAPEASDKCNCGSTRHMRGGEHDTRCPKYDAEKEGMRSMLAAIITDLPGNRDWLDPDLEKEMRAAVGYSKDFNARPVTAGKGLSALLVSPEKGAWLKTLNALMEGFGCEQLAEWWCDLNERQWPIDCPLEPFEQLPSGVMSLVTLKRWDVAALFDALTNKLDDNYLSLVWRARHAHGKELIYATAYLEQTRPL